MLTAEIQPRRDLIAPALAELIGELRHGVTGEIPRIVDVYLMPVADATAGGEPDPLDPDYWRWRFPEAEQT